MKADLTFFWDYSFVHQYYLDFIEKQFEPDGFLGLWGSLKSIQAESFRCSISTVRALFINGIWASIRFLSALNSKICLTVKSTTNSKCRAQAGILD